MKCQNSNDPILWKKNLEKSNLIFINFYEPTFGKTPKKVITPTRNVLEVSLKISSKFSIKFVFGIRNKFGKSIESINNRIGNYLSIYCAIKFNKSLKN